MRRVINWGRYSVRKYCWHMVSAGVVVLLLIGAPVSAQENTNPDIEEKAMAVLKRGMYPRVLEALATKLEI